MTTWLKVNTDASNAKIQVEMHWYLNNQIFAEDAESSFQLLEKAKSLCLRHTLWSIRSMTRIFLLG